MDSCAAWQSDTNSSSTCYGRNHTLMEGAVTVEQV